MSSTQTTKTTKTPHKNNSSTINQQLQQIIAHESAALEYLISHFPDNAHELVAALHSCTGRIVISGIGKSGLVARKLAATFSSTGTPAFFLHPTEALHGDIGMVQSGDVCLMLSKSGTGEELVQLASLFKRSGVVTALLCCNEGKLLSLVDIPVVLPFKKEACELNLAPTSSSTLTLAFGDALAIIVSKLKGFAAQDFARLHPAGALGRSLLSTVPTYMHTGALLSLHMPTDHFRDVIVGITGKKLGVGIVVDRQTTLLGIITDGDIRRACEQKDLFEKTAEQIMTRNPKVAHPNMRAQHALDIMEQFNITSLVVVDVARRVVGLVHIHDLIKAGISTSR